jgi:peptide deformylase
MSETTTPTERESRARREARREIRVIGDPVLRERAREVVTFDRALRKLAKRMLRIMHDAPGIGLAATQVGVVDRLIVYDIDDDPRILVNPAVIELSEEREEGDEGCLSVPGVAMPVERALRIRVKASDETGAALDFVAQDLEARVIQHEIDHLVGVLIVDRTTREARAVALRALRDGTAAEPAAGGL